MMKHSTKSNRSEKTLQITTPKWIGGSFLELVQAFNNRYLETLTRAARRGEVQTLPAIPRRHQCMWTSLDRRALRRASLCPVILADFKFRDVAWWRSAANAEPPGNRDVDGEPIRRIGDMEVARDALTVAWLTVRRTRLFDGLVFTIGDGCSA
jgi:hypothetical protein